MFKKLLKLLIFTFSLQLSLGKNNKNNQNIVLNSTNFLLVKGEINDRLANSFLYNLNKIKKKDRPKQLIFIDSFGGSVDSGMRMIEQINRYKLKCYANNAYSMAFVIFQSCNYRYVSEFSKLMQHQIRFGLSDEIRKMENFFDYVKEIEDKLINIQINKLNISRSKFIDLTNNEWWIFGSKIINSDIRLADKSITIECASKLTMENYTLDNIFSKEIWSRCPIVYEPLEVTFNKEFKSLFI